MAHLKGSKWYRSPSLRYDATPEQVQRQEAQYLQWLAVERQMGDLCPQCKGRGRMSAMWGDRACGYCAGSGGDGTAAARAYVDEQRNRLETLAYDATDRVRERLTQWGFRPRQYGSMGYEDRETYAAPGVDGFIFVSTKRWHRSYFRDEKPPVSIVIGMGRAPSDYELDMLVEDAINELIGEPELGMAA